MVSGHTRSGCGTRALQALYDPTTGTTLLARWVQVFHPWSRFEVLGSLRAGVATIPLFTNVPCRWIPEPAAERRAARSESVCVLHSVDPYRLAVSPVTLP